MKKYPVTTALIIALILMAWWNFRLRSNNEELSALNSVYENTLTKERDESGKLTAEVADLRVNSQKALDHLKAMTEEQKMLKEINAEYKRLYSAIAVNAVTNSKGKDKTTILPGDTIYKDNMVYVYPVYTDTIQTTFRSGVITADRDSIAYDIRERVPLKFAQSMKGGFFKRKEATLTVTCENPAVDITGMASYSLKEPKRRFGVGPYLGYGITSEGKFSTQIGIGLHWRIL